MEWVLFLVRLAIWCDLALVTWASWSGHGVGQVRSSLYYVIKSHVTSLLVTLHLISWNEWCHTDRRPNELSVTAKMKVFR